VPAPERIVAAVADLQPESRAVIELSVRRGMTEHEIAVLLRMEASEVRRRREAATDELAGALGVSGDRDRRSLRDQLARLDQGAWESRPEPARSSQDRPDGPGARGRRAALSSWAAVVVGLVVLAAVAATVLIDSGSRDDELGKEPAPPDNDARSETSTGGTAPEKPAAAPKQTTGPVVTFQRLRGTNGRGTAQLTRSGDGARVRLRVTSLLRPVGGGYAVWLFNSPEDARPLFSTRATTLNTTLGLPSDYRRFRYIEVSREPTQDPSHSGLSLLRAPLDGLAIPPG